LDSWRKSGRRISHEWQIVTLGRRHARALGIAAAAALIVAETEGGEQLEGAELEKAAVQAGQAAAKAISNPQVEG